jgi:hypothetical protein
MTYRPGRGNATLKWIPKGDRLGGLAVGGRLGGSLAAGVTGSARGTGAASGVSPEQPKA